MLFVLLRRFVTEMQTSTQLTSAAFSRFCNGSEFRFELCKSYDVYAKHETYLSKTRQATRLLYPIVLLPPVIHYIWPDKNATLPVAIIDAYNAVERTLDDKNKIKQY